MSQMAHLAREQVVDDTEGTSLGHLYNDCRVPGPSEELMAKREHGILP